MRHVINKSISNYHHGSLFHLQPKCPQLVAEFRRMMSGRSPADLSETIAKRSKKNGRVAGKNVNRTWRLELRTWPNMAHQMHRQQPLKALLKSIHETGRSHQVNLEAVMAACRIWSPDWQQRLNNTIVNAIWLYSWLSCTRFFLENNATGRRCPLWSSRNRSVWTCFCHDSWFKKVWDDKTA